MAPMETANAVPALRFPLDMAIAERMIAKPPKRGGKKNRDTTTKMRAAGMRP